MRWLLRIALVAVVTLSSSLGFAGVADKLGFRVKGKVQGKAQPELVFAPTQDVAKITVTLWRDGGSKTQRQVAAVKKGTERTISIAQPEGKFHYKAKIEVDWAGGKKDTLRIQFDMTRSGGFAIAIDPKEVDLDGKSLAFTLTGPGKRAQLVLIGKDGTSLSRIERDLKGAAAGTRISMKWKAPKSEVARLVLKAWSTAGFWKETTLEPISLRIPHQDVVFDSGRAAVKRSEEPKLKDTLVKLKKAAKMQTSGLGVRLYIAGYCDTVGDPAGNRMLSTHRARSIGLWFRRKGLKLPIFYQGFGEDVLAVKTPDETAEPGNRRALYLLATQTPADASDFPGAKWKKL
jgi:outer membrane protein OmpA-like peptidoglycan-associated protein